MTLMFRKFKELEKTSMSFFASFEKIQNMDLMFCKLCSKKLKENINLFFCNQKTHQTQIQSFVSFKNRKKSCI